MREWADSVHSHIMRDQGVAEGTGIRKDREGWGGRGRVGQGVKEGEAGRQRTGVQGGGRERDTRHLDQTRCLLRVTR